WPVRWKARVSDAWLNQKTLSPVCWHTSTRQSSCYPTTPGARKALLDLFAQEFLDFHARDHGDSLPWAFLGTNGATSTDIPIDNDDLMRAVAGIRGIVNLIDTIDWTKVHAPFAARTAIDINPGFWPRSTRALRSLRHDVPPLVETSCFQGSF